MYIVVSIIGILKHPTRKSQKARLKIKQLLVVLIFGLLAAIASTNIFPAMKSMLVGIYCHYLLKTRTLYHVQFHRMF